jgi:hypothetical protein
MRTISEMRLNTLMILKIMCYSYTRVNMIIFYYFYKIKAAYIWITGVQWNSTEEIQNVLHWYTLWKEIWRSLFRWCSFRRGFQWSRFSAMRYIIEMKVEKSTEAIFSSFLNDGKVLCERILTSFLLNHVKIKEHLSKWIYFVSLLVEICHISVGFNW